MMGVLWILLGISLILFRWIVQKELDRHKLEDYHYEEEHKKKDLD